MRPRLLHTLHQPTELGLWIIGLVFVTMVAMLVWDLWKNPPQPPGS